MFNTKQIHSMSDFLRNHKAHVARLKETRTPEVLTVNGRAELVILDTETYDNMIEQLSRQKEKEIADARAHMAQALKNTQPVEPATESEKENRHAILDELITETEQLGLY